MKLLNQKLFSTVGLFVALLGLTSFNPFSYSYHLAHQDDQEEKTELASVTAAVQTQKQINTIALAVTQERLESRGPQPNNKDLSNWKPQVISPKPSETGPISKAIGLDDKSVTEASACVDGKCEDKSQDQSAAKQKDNEEKVQETANLENECDGLDYSERYSCLKGIAKNVKKNSDEYEDLVELVKDFIEDATYDEDVSDRRLRRISKILSVRKTRHKYTIRSRSNDREVQKKIDDAIAYRRALKTQEAAEKRLESYENQIRSIEDQISTNGLDGNSMNTQANYYYYQLMMQRKNLIYQIENQLGSVQQTSRRALGTGDTKDAFLTDLRANLSDSYTNIASSYADFNISSKLLTLEAEAIVSDITNNSAINNAGNGMNSDRLGRGYSQNSQYVGSNYQSSPYQIGYNSMDPNGVNNYNQFPNNGPNYQAWRPGQPQQQQMYGQQPYTQFNGQQPYGRAPTYGQPYPQPYQQQYQPRW